MWLDLVRIHTSIDIALLCFSLKPPIAAAAYLFVKESCKHLEIYDKWPQLLTQNLWITLHIKGIVSILVLTRQRNQKNAARRQRAWQPWYPQRRSFHSQRMHQQLSILGAQSSQRRHCNINKRVKGCRVSAIPSQYGMVNLKDMNLLARSDEAKTAIRGAKGVTNWTTDGNAVCIDEPNRIGATTTWRGKRLEKIGVIFVMQWQHQKFHLQSTERELHSIHRNISTSKNFR